MKLFNKKKTELFRGTFDPLHPQNWGHPTEDLSPDGKTICLIIEGAYPYIAGGVSTWMHQYIKGFMDYRFKILSIMASKEQKKQLSYTFPENVIEFRTVYLNGFIGLEKTRKKLVPLSPDEREELRKFLLFDHTVNWETVTSIICSQDKLGTPIDFLMSTAFFDELVYLYRKKFPQEGFTNFFWTFRSMLVSLICIMQQKLPEADIYHAISTGYAGLLGLIAKHTYNRPFILTEHGIYAREREEEILKSDWVKGNYKNLWIDYFYFLSRAAYRSCDYSVALFEKHSEIQQNLGADKNRSLVIPNGVDCKSFSQEREHHVGMNIGAVLRLVPIKDVKTLLRAFYYVQKKYKDTKLYIIGPDDEDEEYARECRMLVEELEISKGVEFTGRVDIKEIMKKLDVIVLTSISEAQPLVILESFACRIPVVATDVGSCRELIKGNDDQFGSGGIITKPVSPRETADALLLLYENLDLRTELGQNGYFRVINYYNMEKIFQAYRNMYVHVLKQNEKGKLLEYVPPETNVDDRKHSEKSELISRRASKKQLASIKK